ncbi:unnamed protein product [Phytophthora fragariaefolia]|uniref:Unnamed protein product n=1 Tax=Phytophthora fragariaefolia TaxID=1490495 RepID=A0A9W6XMW2_9STRA|nr:unnamed protein product [Phytophthora fragariaefolia]
MTQEGNRNDVYAQQCTANAGEVSGDYSRIGTCQSTRSRCNRSLLLDSGAEVSIVDTTFAREAGCRIDTSVAQDCAGIRIETYHTIGRSRIKVTLAGNLVYFMNLWVGDLSGQQPILGMNFTVPAGVRIDSADGTSCLPD